MKFSGIGKSSRIGENALSQRSTATSAWVCTLCAILVLCVSSICGLHAMQTPETPGTPAHVHHVRAKAKGPHKRRSHVPEKKVAPPLRPSEVAAQPAMISLKNRELTIEANNSDLAQILHEVAHISGMTINGLNQSTRIFGAYGPGNPTDVLSRLLAGSGYNFIMAGDTKDGAPRELLLTAKNSKAPALTPANPPPAASVPADSSDQSQQAEPEVQPAESNPPDADVPPAPADATSPDPTAEMPDPQIHPDNPQEPDQEPPQEPQNDSQ